MTEPRSKLSGLQIIVRNRDKSKNPPSTKVHVSRKPGYNKIIIGSITQLDIKTLIEDKILAPIRDEEKKTGMVTRTFVSRLTIQEMLRTERPELDKVIISNTRLRNYEIERARVGLNQAITQSMRENLWTTSSPRERAPPKAFINPASVKA